MQGGEYRIDSAWGFILPKGAGFQPHSHKPSSLSGCFYLKIPSETSSQFILETVNHNEQTCEQAIDEPAEGDLNLFAGQFRHEVTPNQSDELRIGYAFNMMDNVDILDRENVITVQEAEKFMGMDMAFGSTNKPGTIGTADNPTEFYVVGNKKELE